MRTPLQRTSVFMTIVTSLASAGTLHAQTTLMQISPPLPTYNADRFGASMAMVGDVDGDGAQDYAVASPQDYLLDPGRVSIVSGATGAAIRQIHGLGVGSEFGILLEAVGDVDSDGYVDLLAVGPANNAPGANASYELRLFSARTGATLWNYLADNTGCCNGYGLGGGEDVNGDGVSDYAAAGFWNNLDTSIQVRSGATHALILDIGVGAQDDLAGGFAFLGDIDGDQRSEIAYCAMSGGLRVVHVVSGAGGSVLHTLPLSNPPPADYCWGSMERVGDFDGDASADFAFGEWCNGRVWVVSGATGSLIRLHTIQALVNTYRAPRLAGEGDLDGDGVADLLVGVPRADDGGYLRGTVLAFSGRTGVELFQAHYGGDQSFAGSSLANPGDVDGDGFDDFAVGLPSYAGPRVLVQSPIPLPPHAVGTPQVNSLGCTPVLSWSGIASATSAAPFTIQGMQIVSQKTGTFFYGIGDPIALPFRGGTLSAPGPWRRTPHQSSGGSATGGDCTGVLSIDFNERIQSGVDPALLPTARVVGQFWSRDPQAPPTTHLTGAIELVVGP